MFAKKLEHYFPTFEWSVEIRNNSHFIIYVIVIACLVHKYMMVITKRASSLIEPIYTIYKFLLFVLLPGHVEYNWRGGKWIEHVSSMERLKQLELERRAYLEACAEITMCTGDRITYPQQDCNMEISDMYRPKISVS